MTLPRLFRRARDVSDPYEPRANCVKHRDSATQRGLAPLGSWRGPVTAVPAIFERAVELATLDDCLAQTAAGSGRAVMIAGSAGIGKSRLLAEAAEAAAGRGFRVLRARGSELEAAFAFG